MPRQRVRFEIFEVGNFKVWQINNIPGYMIWFDNPQIAKWLNGVWFIALGSKQPMKKHSLKLRFDLS